MPDDYQILTRRGWLKHDQVRAGDETIGYNPATGQSEWTRITAVHHYDEAPVVRYGNHYWSAECTPSHRWVAERVVRRPVDRAPPGPCPECGADGGIRGPFTSQRAMQIHRARQHGVPGACHGVPTTERVAETLLLPLQDMSPQHRIVLARKACTAAAADITTREASLLGWVAGDGSVDARYGSFSIYQSKRQFFPAIDDACGADPRHRRYEARAGRKAHWKPTVTWHLSAPYSRDLMRRAGHPRRDAVALVLAMSTEQRDAWLEAVLLSEGSRAGGKTVYYQNAGEVADAIELAVYLSGHRPSRTERFRQNRIAVAITETSPYAGGPSRRARLSAAEPRAVWCPTTELGSWTARSASGIFLTGNSGGNPNAVQKVHDINWPNNLARGLLQIIPTTFRAFGNGGPFGPNIMDPRANIWTAINYTLKTRGLGGMRAYIGKGHGYARGGIIAEPVIGQGVRTGRPYAIAERGPELISPLTGPDRIAPPGSRGQVVVNVYPRPGQDERQIAAAVSRQLAWAQAGGAA